jgi:hypothetical protein
VSQAENLGDELAIVQLFGLQLLAHFADLSLLNLLHDAVLDGDDTLNARTQRGLAAVGEVVQLLVLV